MNENSTATNQVNQATQTALEGFEPVPVVSEKEKAREEARTLKERFHNAVSCEQGMDTIRGFMASFGIASILHSCGIVSLCPWAIPIAEMFAFLLGQVFCQYSIYRREKLKQLPEGISTSSVSRFLNNPKFRWETFLSKVSEKALIFINKLDGPDEKKVLTADDTDVDRVIRGRGCAYEGSGKRNKKKKVRKHKGKRTELVARKYDHARKVHSTGFRMLTIGFADQFTFIPLGFVLLSSKKAKNIVGDAAKKFKKNSAAFMRRKLACSATMDALTTLLVRALKYVKNVRHICVDRWFSNPSQIYELMDKTGLHVLTILKHNKTKYQFNGQLLTICEIRKYAKKHYRESRNLIVVNILVPGKNGNVDHCFYAKVVFVQNRANRKQWISILSTDTDLTAEEIIEYYSLRWKTETFFWTAKMLLGLNGESHAMSYDAQTAHAAIVCTRYIMLAIEQRKAEDPRSVGELFAMIVEEQRSMEFGEVLRIFSDAVFSAIDDTLHLSQTQMDTIITKMFNALPPKIAHYLKCARWVDEDEVPPQKTRRKKTAAA